MAAGLLVSGLFPLSAQAQKAADQTQSSSVKVTSPEEGQQAYMTAFQDGKIDRALDLSKQVLALIAESYGRTSEEYLVELNMRGQMAEAAGRMSELAETMDQLLPMLASRFGENTPNILSARLEYADILEGLGRYSDAADQIEKVYAVSVESQGENALDTLLGFNKYVQLLGDSERLNEADKFSEQAVDRTETALGLEHEETLKALNTRATVLDKLGRFSDSEPIYTTLLQRTETAFGSMDVRTLIMMGNYASVLEQQGRIDEAVTLYKNVHETKNEVLGPDDPSTIDSLNSYGVGLVAQRDNARAEKVLAQALEASRRVMGNDHPITIRVLGNYGAVLENLGRLDDAGPIQQEALELSQRMLGADHPDTLIRMNNLAVIRMRQKDYEKGVPLYAETFELIRRKYGDDHPQTLQIASSMAHFLLETPGAEEFAWDAAGFAVKGWRRRSNALGTDPRAEAQRDKLQRDQTDYYEDLADAAWAAQSANSEGGSQYREAAFGALQSVLEGSASRSIARSAARRAAEEGGGLGEIAGERQLLADEWLTVEEALTAAIAAQDDEAKDARVVLRDKQGALGQQMAALDLRLEAEAPEYFALARLDPLSITEAQSMLEEDEAALLLAPTEFGTHVIAITSDSFEWVRSDWDREKTFQSSARLLWDVGANVDVPDSFTMKWAKEGEGAYPYDFVTAHALYDQLIAPVATTLKGKEHVFVLPTGGLSALPLGILVSEVPSGINGDPEVLRNASWLADRFAFVTAPSLQSLRFLREYREENTERANSFIGFGNPILGEEAQLRGGGVAKRGGDRNTPNYVGLFGDGNARGGSAIAEPEELRMLASLPGTEAELQAMWQAFGEPQNALFLADAATETVVRETALEADVIVFATHGVLAGELYSINEPGLVLTPPEDAVLGDDGYLAMSEIAALNIDAEWVILSACNTAGGDGSDFSGLSGLARAFFFAGARKLLASNWPVRDDVAAVLTVRTIEIAATNPALSRAQALQQAMREIRMDKRADSDTDSWAHPNAWAPFILVGDR